MTNRTIPDYQDGYVIEYRSSDDLYHCLNNGKAMSKRGGEQLATYRSLALAKKFMQAQGAQEVVEEPKKNNGLWTPPPAAVIAPLEDQLAALPDDAPRFVVVEAGYATYKTLGYACYDRQEQAFTGHKDGPSQSWNNVWEKRGFAEKTCDLCNADPPVKWHYDRSFARALAKGNAEDAGESVAEIFFDEDSQIDYFGPNSSRKLAAEPEPERECTFVGRDSHQIGDIITDKSGHKYRVIEPSFYLSERDVADLEDANDIFVDAGWHTNAVLVEVQV
jgi:hypothetical protein